MKKNEEKCEKWETMRKMIKNNENDEKCGKMSKMRKNRKSEAAKARSGSRGPPAETGNRKPETGNQKFWFLDSKPESGFDSGLDLVRNDNCACTCSMPAFHFAVVGFVKARGTSGDCAHSPALNTKTSFSRFRCIFLVNTSLTLCSMCRSKVCFMLSS